MARDGRKLNLLNFFDEKHSFKFFPVVRILAPFLAGAADGLSNRGERATLYGFHTSHVP